MTRIYSVTAVERIRVAQQDKEPLDTERGITKTIAVEGNAEDAIAKAKGLILAEAQASDGKYETTGIDIQSVVLQNVAE